MINNETKIAIENYFEKTGYWLFYNPKKVLFILFIIVAAFLSQLSSLKIDTSVEALLHKNDPFRTQYDSFRQEFGKEEIIAIAVKSEKLFSKTFLLKLKEFHKTLETEVPHLKAVNSLVNARDVYGKNETLHIEKLLEKWPENQVDIKELKNKILNNPVFKDNIISEKGDYTTVTIEIHEYKDRGEIKTDFSDLDVAPFDSASPDKNEEELLSVEDNSQLVNTVKKIAARFNNPDFEIFIAGAPVVNDTFNVATVNDAGLTSVLALAAITFFLILVFRRVSGVFLAWLVVLAALFCVYGIMAIFNVPVKLTTTIIPSFLLAVGVGDSVHILTIFYDKFGDGYNKADAIAYALGHSGFAVVMTSLTTAVGLLSFSFAELAAIADIGIFASAGVMLALLFSIYMIPPFLAILPIKPIKTNKTKGKTADRILLFFAAFAEKHAGEIVIFSIFLLIISVFYSLKLNFSHDTINWFPDSMAVKTDIKVIDKEFKGSVLLEIIIDTEKENGLYSYKLLNGIDKASDEIGKIHSASVSVGKVTGIIDIVKEINKALHNNNELYYSIPQDDKKIAENLFLFECSNPEDLSRITDSKMSKTRITVKTPTVDAVAYQKLIMEIASILEKNFPNEINITITGMASLLARTISATLKSISKSYIIAFSLITVFLIILVGDLRLGLVSMVPNLLPIIAATGFMGYSGIPLDMCTIMVGSIAIGLVVDDTLHFMYHFQKHYNESGCGVSAVRETLLGTGRALLFTSLILSSGFYVVMFASLRHTITFGFLLGTIILLALVADFLLASSIVILMTKKTRTRLPQKVYQTQGLN